MSGIVLLTMKSAEWALMSTKTALASSIAELNAARPDAEEAMKVEDGAVSWDTSNVKAGTVIEEWLAEKHRVWDATLPGWDL